MKRELVGYCGVDSGMIWIGDPCYIKHHEELNNSEKWNLFCQNLEDIPGEKYQGVLTHTRYGDGEYPVYITKDKDGNVKKMEIVF